MKIHPHHDIIVAYLEGKQIQYYSLGDWIDLAKISNNWGNFPSFNPNVEYREKPMNQTYRYNVIQIGRAPIFRAATHGEIDNLELEFNSKGELITARVI
jgi:hypothetical protein